MHSIDLPQVYNLPAVDETDLPKASGRIGVFSVHICRDRPRCYSHTYYTIRIVVGGVCLLHLWEFGSPNPVCLSMCIL